MKKTEAEKGIRQLATQWADETGYIAQQGHYPSFSHFKDWLSAKGHRGYLDFRSSVSADFVAEGWFESELMYWRRHT